MSKSLYKIKEMLCDALDEYAKKGDLTAGSLEAVDKLTHSLKSVETILAMREWDDEDGASYAGPDGGGMGNGGGGISGRRGRSRATGRFISRDGGYSGRRGYSRGGMSYDGARDELVEHVEELMEMAKDEPTRQMIERFKRDLETA